MFEFNNVFYIIYVTIKYVLNYIMIYIEIMYYNLKSFCNDSYQIHMFTCGP